MLTSCAPTNSIFSKKKCSTHSSSSFRNGSMKFEQTSSQWKLAVESRDSSERLLLVRIKLVDIFQQKVVVSGGSGKWRPTVLADVQNDTNCQDACAIAPFRESRRKYSQRPQRNSLKQKNKTKQIYRRILTDEKKLCH